MPWDIINMTSTYLSVQATTTNQTACQAACSADLKCQYYVWYNYTVSGNGDDQCYLRLATANITKISGFDSATSTDIILFEVRCALEGRMAGNASAFPPRARLSLPTRTPSWCSSLPPQRALTPIHHPPLCKTQVKQGQYAVYAAKDHADAAIGNTLTAGATDFATVKTFCDNSALCMGMSVAGTAGTWRAFSGSKWEGAVGKVRVVGETINSWIATPTP